MAIARLEELDKEEKEPQGGNMRSSNHSYEIAGTECPTIYFPPGSPYTA
jgi:hypothetical protein